jgi:GDP-L-fucose synthase
MRICCTGGNGMVGKCIQDFVLTSELKYEEHEFVFLNRSLNNEQSVDLTNREHVLNYFENHAFDYIIHLAADVGGLFKNLNGNTSMFSNNIKINENIMEACIKNNIKRGVFILSSCIFPHEPSVFPMTEEMIHESPPHYSNEGYAYAKRMMHMQCQQYNQTMNTKFICLIPVNLYGPYDNFNPHNSHLIPGLMHRFHHNKQCGDNSIAYGTGTPLRQMLFAPDFAHIICNTLFDLTIKATVLICCNDEEFQIKEIVEKIANVMDMDMTLIQWDTTKSDGCMRKTVSNSSFKSFFPNFVFTPFHKGIKDSYDWYISNLHNIRK